MIQLLLLRDRKQISEDEWSRFCRLQSHEQDLKEPGRERWQEICLMSKGAHAYSGTTTSADMTIASYCRVSKPQSSWIGMCF